MRLDDHIVLNPKLDPSKNIVVKISLETKYPNGQIYEAVTRLENLSELSALSHLGKLIESKIEYLECVGGDISISVIVKDIVMYERSFWFSKLLQEAGARLNLVEYLEKEFESDVRVALTKKFEQAAMLIADLNKVLEAIGSILPTKLISLSIPKEMK